jgi:zinc transporter, ZIP family
VEDFGLVLSAFIFGLVASSALVIGAVAGACWTPPRPMLAAALAFASGALITALAFDLFQESFKHGGAWFSSIGLLLGATAFVVADERSTAISKGLAAASGPSPCWQQ